MLKLDRKNPLASPAGTRDYVFSEAAAHRHVERSLMQQLADRGFQEIITPSVEYLSLFNAAGKSGASNQSEADERTYRFLDRDGQLLALRSDFTAQIARIAASRFAGRKGPVKVTYSGKIFRAEPQHAGRKRERWQVGLEILNDGSLTADRELIETILLCLQAIGIENYRLAIGHSDLFNSLIDGIKLSATEIERLKYLIDRKDVARLGELLLHCGLTEEIAQLLQQLPGWHGNESVLQEARAAKAPRAFAKAIDELQNLYSGIASDCKSGRVFFDLGEVSKMNYYTGIIVRVYAEGAGEEIGSGGRYDRLVSRFGTDMPAVGLSFDVGNLVTAIASQGAG